MPKPSLTVEYQALESDIIETMIAGLHEWRPDLDYPESYSDMSGCVRALFRMYEIKRRPLAKPVKELLAEHEKGCNCGNCQQ